jgi:hypothetical protein
MCNKDSTAMLKSFSTSEKKVPVQCATDVKDYKYLYASSQFPRNKEALIRCDGNWNTGDSITG